MICLVTAFPFISKKEQIEAHGLVQVKKSRPRLFGAVADGSQSYRAPMILFTDACE
jgi:hypothetical protein